MKGTIHWVSAAQAKDAEVRLYDRLFTVENPNAVPEGKTFMDYINPESLSVVSAKIEPYLYATEGGIQYQFMRKGYFILDSKESTPESLSLIGQFLCETAGQRCRKKVSS